MSERNGTTGQYRQRRTTAAAVDNGSSDACGISLALSKTTFNCGNVGANAVVLTVTDVNGNTSTAAQR
ncbi:MAG: hypothetical protein IPM95_08085 [Sphingobacteriales bacterium]|nr:hypothetical protein [Sphingobacteriales bacterium]